MSDAIVWLPQSILGENVEASRKMYEFIERDFETCLEYVALDRRHLDVYSPKLANTVLRVGPEILRLFNLILFNESITRFCGEQPTLERQILNIQKKKQGRKDSFMDYLRALPNLKTKSVEVKTLEEKIRPFETTRISLPDRKTPIKSVFWWEWGYNALRHRTIREFKESATLKHALFSLAGLWVLHDRLDRDWGRKGLPWSRIFRPEIGTYVAR